MPDCLGLRIDLKIFADAQIQRQSRANLVGVVDVEAQVRNVERELGLSRALEEVVVNSESKVREIGKSVGATERSILRLRIGIESAKGQVRQVRVRELDTELESVLPAQIADVIRDLPQSLVGAAAGEARITQLKVCATSDVAAGGNQQNRREGRIDQTGRSGILVIARKGGVNLVQKIAAVSVAPAGADLIVANKGVSQGALSEERGLGAEYEAARESRSGSSSD